MSTLNTSDNGRDDDAGVTIAQTFEQGRRAYVRKAGQMFELPSAGDPDLIPKCHLWALGVDDTAFRTTPDDMPGRGWLLILVAFMYGAAAAFVYLSSPLIPVNKSWDPIGLSCAIFGLVFGTMILRVVIFTSDGAPTIFNRRKGYVVQMQGRDRIEAEWSKLRPFVERNYTAQGLPMYRFRLLELDAEGKVVKNINVKSLANGPADCARYYEYLKRYMAGQWEGLPDTLLKSGLRRPLLREFRSGFGWMFGRKRAWHERPLWLKALQVVLMPITTFVIWPWGFFTLLGTRLGWLPRFPSDVEADARGGSVPPELAPRIHEEPPLALTEKLLYPAIMLGCTLVWPIWGWRWVAHWMLSR